MNIITRKEIQASFLISLGGQVGSFFEAKPEKLILRMGANKNK